MASNIVIEDKEQVAMKVEKLRGSQPLGLGVKEKPFKFVKKESWHEMTIHDDQE